MSMGLADGIRNARLNVIRDGIDAGGSAGTLDIYSAPRPSKGAATTDQVLLATVTFDYPCAPDAGAGELVFSVMSSGVGLGTAEATWARIRASGGAFVADASVGAMGSSAEVILSDTAIVTGAPVEVQSGKLTEGNA